MNAAPVLSRAPHLHALQAAQQQVHLDPTSSSPLPPTPPTANTPAAPVQPAPERAPEHVDVQYTNGQITVDATNGGLSSVVHEVAHKAGIKVTGSVVDERVFGHYGPAAPSVILAALLDGTGSNMLLVDDAKGSSELILTPRRGGVTPPDPNASSQRASDEQEESPEIHYNPPSQPFRPPTINNRGAQIGSPDGTATAIPSTPSAPDSGDSSQQNGGAKTPQQIYDQLQKMMQQHPATAIPQ